MNLAITCGPSYEPIDGARRLTNFSTGRLGIFLSNHFTALGHRVWCFKGEQAPCPDAVRAQVLTPFSTNQDLADKLAALARAERMDAVLHAAALCDFKVAKVENASGQTIQSRKFSTREGQL